jgi:magnesium-transporting ATPase (P-type)
MSPLHTLQRCTRPQEDPDTIYYQAQSPDEGALVGAVKKLGFSFNVRTPRSVVINVLGVDEVRITSGTRYSRRKKPRRLCLFTLCWASTVTSACSCC